MSDQVTKWDSANSENKEEGLRERENEEEEEKERKRLKTEERKKCGNLLIFSNSDSGFLLPVHFLIDFSRFWSSSSSSFLFTLMTAILSVVVQRARWWWWWFICFNQNDLYISAVRLRGTPEWEWGYTGSIHRTRGFIMICFSLLSSRPRPRGPSRVIKITTLGVFQTVCLIWSLFFWGYVYVFFCCWSQSKHGGRRRGFLEAVWVKFDSSIN